MDQKKDIIKEIIKDFLVKFFDSILEEKKTRIHISRNKIVSFFNEYRNPEYREYVPYYNVSALSDYFINTRKMFYEFVSKNIDILNIYGFSIDNNKVYYKNKEIILFDMI
jgi:hypothetical protein